MEDFFGDNTNKETVNNSNNDANDFFSGWGDSDNTDLFENTNVDFYNPEETGNTGREKKKKKLAEKTKKSLIATSVTAFFMILGYFVSLATSGYVALIVAGVFSFISLICACIAVRALVKSADKDIEKGYYIPFIIVTILWFIISLFLGSNVFLVRGIIYAILFLVETIVAIVAATKANCNEFTWKIMAGTDILFLILSLVGAFIKSNASNALHLFVMASYLLLVVAMLMERLDLCKNKTYEEENVVEDSNEDVVEDSSNNKEYNEEIVEDSNNEEFKEEIVKAPVNDNNNQGQNDSDNFDDFFNNF